MTSKPFSVLSCAAALTVAAALVFAPSASAALGGTADSVTTDSVALKGQLHNTPQVQYDLQTITVGTLIIHEYVTRAGQVFAVTWQGPVPPNLRQLLGGYFTQFQSAAANRARPGNRRQLTVSQPDLVIEASGRLRDFSGLAYVPSLFPAGVSVSDLQ